jgi:hypothetical protein
MDGFVSGAAKPSSTVKISSSTNLKSNSSHKAPNKSMEFHRRIEKTHTLMRGGLKKPASHIQSNLARFKPKSAIEREERAKLTPKHSRVDRFGNPLPPVSPAKAIRKPLRGEIINSSSQSVSSAAASSTAVQLPSMVTSASHQKLERLLDEALIKADSHKEAMRYHAARHFWQRHWFSGPRRWAFMAGLALAFIGVLFVTWQKVPQLSVKMAGMRAHLSPSVPTYRPEGYAMSGPAKAVMGAVTVKYTHSKDPAKTYEITQAQSNLTSQMLALNIVPKGASVQTSQIAGNTVYIYGSSNDAAWVNNGVLYTIKDKASLRSDQLIKIVQGLNP